MGLVVKRFRYDLEGGDHVVIEKWSAIKMLTVIRDMGDLINRATVGLGDDTNVAAFVARLLTCIGDSEAQFTNLILGSICEPKDIDSDDILNWEAEDYIGVLEKIFELNLTEKLQKKFQGLLKRMLFQKSAEEEDAPQQSKQGSASKKKKKTSS